MTTTTDPSSTAPPSTIPDTRDTSYSDRALELKRLVKSLLLNFLELTGVLSCQPAHADAKIEDIRTLFINIHHALNEYRPHQARESAAEMMQEHLDRTRRETVAIRSQVDKARRVLEGLGSLTVPEGVSAAAAAAAAAAVLEDTKVEGSGVGVGREGGWEEMRREREKELWKATDVAFA
jgi:mediator of RNA polymerase II transcription subunit 7